MKSNKSHINTERTHRAGENQLYFTCPMCGVNVSVPEDYRNHDELTCFYCRGIFKNPLIHPNDKSTYVDRTSKNNKFYSLINQKTKHLPIGKQIFRGLLIGFILYAFVKGCTETPEEKFKQYKKNQKMIREYEKKKKDEKEFFEFMEGMEE